MAGSKDAITHMIALLLFPTKYARKVYKTWVVSPQVT